MLLLLFQNNKVLIYPDIQLLRPLQPASTGKNIHGLILLHHSCNVMKFFFAIDNIE